MWRDVFTTILDQMGQKLLFYCLDQQRKHQKRSKVQYLENHHLRQLKQVKKAAYQNAIEHFYLVLHLFYSHKL